MLLRRAAFIVLLPLGLAACDSSALSRLPGFGRTEPAAPVATVPPTTGQPPAVSPLEVPIEVEGTRTTLGTANAAFVDVTAFTATGSGWVAAIRGNNTAIARQGAKVAQVNMRRVDFGQGAEFVGATGGRTASINLRAVACRDAAGATWPMTATVKLTGNTLTGCAAPTGNEPRGFAGELPTIRPVAPATAAPKKVAAKKAAPKAAAPAAPAAPVATPEPAASTPATSTPTPVTPEATTPAAPSTSTPAVTTPAEPAASAPATTPEPAPAATPAPAPEATAPATTPAPAPATPAPATPAPATGTAPAAPIIVPPAN